MSDFNGNFWSLYVAVLTVASILACLILLWVTARKKIVSSSDNTTGHVWDGDLREANNPMPRWWVGMFVLSIVFALAYLVAYPGLGSYAGLLGWSTQTEYEQELALANKELEPLYAKFTAKHRFTRIAAGAPTVKLQQTAIGQLRTLRDFGSPR